MAPKKYRSIRAAKARKRKGFKGVQWQNMEALRGLDSVDNAIGIADSFSSQQHCEEENLRPCTPSQEKLLNSSFNADEDTNSPLTRGVCEELGIKRDARDICYSPKDYALIDLGMLGDFIYKNFSCKQCISKKSTLQMFSEEKKRNGLAMILGVRCSTCQFYVSFCTSKKSKDRNIEVNCRSLLATNALKGGRQALAKFCGIMNLPAPISFKSFNDNLKKVSAAAVNVAENVMLAASKSIREKYLLEMPELAQQDPDFALPIAVSIDGTWQKRGYSSRLGVVFVISIATGEILDYEVLSLFCQECNVNGKKDKNTLDYKRWKAAHEPNCSINYEGSSGAMEAEGAVRIFSRSISTRQLKYITFVGDGDSSTYQVVKEAMNEKYGSRYAVQKEECLGHVQKRMGNALRSMVKNMKGEKLEDGKKISGKGRLTKEKIDTIQRYYGKAIRENCSKGIKEMQNSIWAIYKHIICDPKKSLQEQHELCPKGTNTWCSYIKHQEDNSQKYSEKNRLSYAFLGPLKPVFKRLTDKELLSRCQMGLTQNQNESVHNVLWGKCSKTIFCGRQRVLLAVAETVLVFNTGAGSIRDIMIAAGISNVGLNTIRMLRREDFLRTKTSLQKVTMKYKRYRIRKKADRRKAATSSKKHYSSGAFDTCRLEENIREESSKCSNARQIGKKRLRTRKSHSAQPSKKERTDLIFEPAITIPVPLAVIKNFKS